MRHARADYDRFQDPAGLIPEAEPVFILRGQDICAPIAVRAWADAVGYRGGDVHIISAAKRQAALMEKWQEDMKAKMPDMPTVD